MYKDLLAHKNNFYSFYNFYYILLIFNSCYFISWLKPLVLYSFDEVRGHYMVYTLVIATVYHFLKGFKFQSLNKQWMELFWAVSSGQVKLLTDLRKGSFRTAAGSTLYQINGTEETVDASRESLPVLTDMPRQTLLCESYFTLLSITPRTMKKKTIIKIVPNKYIYYFDDKRFWQWHCLPVL